MIKSYDFFFWMNHLLQSELTSNSLASFIAFFIRSIHLPDRVPGSTNLFVSPVSVRKKKRKEKKRKTHRNFNGMKVNEASLSSDSTEF